MSYMFLCLNAPLYLILTALGFYFILFFRCPFQLQHRDRRPPRKSRRPGSAQQPAGLLWKIQDYFLCQKSVERNGAVNENRENVTVDRSGPRRKDGSCFNKFNNFLQMPESWKWNLDVPENHDIMITVM